MTIFLTIVHVIVCLTLILVILLQAGRGQGLTGPTFASGNVQSLFGTRAGDFLSKATTVAALCFLLTSIGLDLFEVGKSRSLLNFSKHESTMDMDAIKKALENVKAEGDAAGKDAAGAVEAVKDEAKTTAAAVESKVAEVTPEPAPVAKAEKPAA